MGAALVVGACTTDVEGNNNFTTGAGSSSTTSASGEGPTTASSTTEAASTSTTSASTTEGVESSSSSGADSSSSSSFSGGGAQCGNGEIEGDEDCDCGDDGECTEEELGGLACESTSDPLVPGVLTGGPLGCNMASCRYDTSQCVYCGDGELNGNEVCELDQPIQTSCSELGKGTAGKLLCMETCQVDTTACTECGYQFDFEGDQCDQWTTLITTGAAANPTSWECGNPGPFAAGPGAGKTGVLATGLNGNYFSSESGYIRSGPLDLSNCGDQTVTLTMRHWFDFQGGPANSDGGVVQVTTGDPEALVDGWITIEPTGGTLYVPVPAATSDFPPVDGNAAFSGLDPDEGTWVESTFDVTEYSGGPFAVRFLIGSGDTTEHAGWYIDNVEILGSGGA